MKEELTFLKNKLSQGETIIVATSGGPDSMCLLSLVNKLQKEMDLKIVCAHVNHKLRKESDTEQVLVEKYAKENNDIFELLEINEYIDGDFSEEDARKRRYKFFFELQKRYNSNTLLTAHHGDDLIETILMRLTRGSNLNGYIGIKKETINEERKILRPLLTKNKKEILKYINDNNIPYVIDESNSDQKYTRNRYRKIVLPFLYNENTKVNEKYLKFSEELNDYENFVINYIKEHKIILDNCIDINKLEQESEFIKRKSIEVLIREVQKSDILNISDNQVKEIIKLGNNKSIDLNNNYKAINSYGKLVIVKNTPNNFIETEFTKDMEVNNFMFYYNPQDGNDSNSCIYLSSEEIKLPLKLRPWQDGDKMTIKNLNGSKKISEIFINSKIPRHIRDSYPVLVDSENNVLWLPNIKKSQFAKDKSQKYDIIIKCEAR